MLEIKKNSRQIPKVKEICGDKNIMICFMRICSAFLSSPGKEKKELLKNQK